MSDSTIASTSAFGVTSNNNEQMSFEPPPSEVPDAHSHGGSHAGPQLHLKDALEWLLGANMQNSDDDLNQEEKTVRRNRRMELLMWILNLEPRLAPYGDY